MIFAAKSRRGGSETDTGQTVGGIFKPGLLRRSGLLENYTRSVLDSYQVSYWASLPNETSPSGAEHKAGSKAEETGGGGGRRTATLRKNAGFRLVSVGTDNIAPGHGPRRVRIMKVGRKIRVETAGTVSLRFEDDAETNGLIPAKGHIALAQSARSGLVTYRDLKVWRIKSKRENPE